MTEHEDKREQARAEQTAKNTHCGNNDRNRQGHTTLTVQVKGEYEKRVLAQCSCQYIMALLDAR